MARNVSIQLPQWVNNGSPAWVLECPLLGVERTSILGDWRSPCSQNEASKPSVGSISFAGMNMAPIRYWRSWTSYQAGAVRSVFTEWRP